MVGVVNQQWRDVVALLWRQMGVPIHKYRAECETGWPESFKIEQIAVLQRPYPWPASEPKDREARTLCRAYFEGLLAACESVLRNTSTTVTVTPKPPPPQRRSKIAPDGWWERDFAHMSNGRISITPKPFDVTTYTVTAPAFAAWLAANREPPSVHIQAWFDAVGVAGAGVPDAQPKPLQRTSAQDAAMLQELRRQNYDPLALPKNPPGRPGVKAAIRKAIDGKGLFAGGTVFDKSWERLSANGEIVTKD